MNTSSSARCHAHNYRVRVLLISILFGLGGCAADLVILGANVEWTDTNKTASASIKNNGKRDAGPFAVYFTAEECPNSANYRPQQRIHVPGLATGAQLSLTADFQSLAHTDNANLVRVYAVSIIADPKNVVPESNERNNWDSRPTQYDVSSAFPLLTYDEELYTILRGIELDEAVAGELELYPGYYRISEHRSSANPADRAIALQVLRRFFDPASNSSAPPRRNEAFVFSIFDRYEYNTAGFRFTGRDLHGHTLAFDIEFQPECLAVTSVRLNCTGPRLTTQRLDGTLSACDVTSEPPWSAPRWE